MTLLNIIIVLVVVGLVLWLINNYIPMDRKIKSILNVVVFDRSGDLVITGIWVARRPECQNLIPLHCVKIL